MSSLEFENVSLNSSTGNPILQGINCRFQSGEFTVITGQGASGKSSLVRLMYGLVKANSGSIRKKARIAYVAQELNSHFLTLRVRDEIALGLSKRQLGNNAYEQCIHDALSWAGLTDRANTLIKELSCSEQRLLAIAVAMAGRPDLYILDEPFAGMDRSTVCRILEKLIELVRQGAGVIVVCHDIERLLAHADRLILLKQGRIIADALPERVIPYLEAHGVRKPNLKLMEMSWLQT